MDKMYKTTIESLKDLLCGNSAKVRVKGKGPQDVESLPFMFISNHEPFDLDDANVNNPWPSRFYSYAVKVFPHWNDETRSKHLHPFGWIKMF